MRFRARLFLHPDADDLHRLDRSVALAGGIFDPVNDIHAIDDLAKNRVPGRAGGKPVEIVVVHGVDKELGAPAIGLAGVGHR